ncbi:MAG: TrkH family potassium uptake protein [Oscillospiraceae bacterium]
MKRKQSMPPARMIAMCFLAIIAVGSILLMLPISHNPGRSITPLDALFTATSATCVTGLVVVDTAETFSFFGRCVILLLIQTGGLGVATIGVGVTLAAGNRMSLYHRNILKASWNIGSMANLNQIYRMVILITVTIELIGAGMLLPVFMKMYPFAQAIGISIFHSVSSFNNAGFDLMGGNMNGFVGYGGNVPLSLITAFLIIAGGIGYLVIIDLLQYDGFIRCALQTKIVLYTSAFLILCGMMLLLAVEDLTPLEAFFQSVSTRTAGFSTIDIGSFTNAGLMVVCLLMFIGASPGSTGGGIKTTTFFVALMAADSAATGRKREVFHRRIDDADISKAFIVILMALLVIITATFAMCLCEPGYDFIRILFEVVSAFATVGLSTGLTPHLGDAARLILIVTMYIGRLGPLTIATVWFFHHDSKVSYTMEHVTIG